MTLITDGFIKCDEHLLVMRLVGIKQISLIENKDDGHAIGFGRGQETVNESGGGLGIVDGDDKQRLIDIGSNDMALLGEIDALADDVVAAVVDVDDPPFVIDRDSVANGHGIRAPYAFDTEVALDLTIKELAIVGEDGVPATCIFYDKTVQTENCKLNSHDFLVLGGNELVDFLDVLIVNLLQFQLCILLIILGETILDGLLQLVLDIATHIAHLDLGLLGNLGALLGEVATALLSGDGDVETDHLAIVFGGNAHIRIHDGFLNAADLLGVPWLDGDGAGIGHAHVCNLVQGHLTAVRINPYTVENGHVGTACTDAVQLLLEEQRCHLHSLFTLLQSLLNV